MEGPIPTDGVGLILVRRKDPINYFLLSVTQQYYSMMGFYYTSRVTGRERVYVVIADTHGIVSSIREREMKSGRTDHLQAKSLTGFTLQDLIEDPLVSEIATRPLTPIRDPSGKIDSEATQKRNRYFKIKIAEVRAKRSKKSVEKWLKQLVGYENGSTNTELINQVILEVGGDYIDPESSRGEKERIEIDPGLLQTYLINSPSLEPIQRIPLPEREPSMISSAWKESIDRNRGFLSEIIRTFVRLLIEDNYFYRVVIDKINQSTPNKEIDPREQQEILNLIKGGNQVVDRVISMLERGGIDREVLRGSINHYQEQVRSSLDRIGLEITHQPTLRSQDRDQFIVVSDPRSSQDHFKITERVGEHLTKISRKIQKGRTPRINLNLFIEHYNQLIEMTGRGNVLPHLPEGQSYSSILVTNDPSTLPIEFEEETRYIPLDGSNLGQCTRRELEELLRYLDIISNGENKYESLRSKVADRLGRE